MIEPGHPEISVSRQCELIGMNRSVWYYRPVDESEEDLLAKRLIDEQYTSTPFYGSRRMTVCLQKQGLDINRKRVTRLMREMGIQAIYPKPKLSISDSGHKIYPYLLGGLHIDRPDQVWSSDITYIRMSKGFVYLTAVMDWYSRYVLSWSLSNTMGYPLLPGSASEGSDEEYARDIQHRPGLAVHEYGIYRGTDRPWDQGQHGLPRPGF